MKIGLLDEDKKTRNLFPNLALMKISAYHKSKGDEVEMLNPLEHYDRVYISKVFDDYISPRADFKPMADEVICGGSAYDLHKNLPDEIEHMCPDYGLYGITDTAYGFLTRGCPRACSFCIVAEKEGRASRKVADLSEWWHGQKDIVVMDPNILACPGKFDLLRQLADSKARVDINQGLDARLLTEEVIEALNQIRLKTIHFAWDFYENKDVVCRGLSLYDKLGKKKVYDRVVYVLVNYNTTLDEDLDRIYTLYNDLHFYPYVMIYDKAHCNPIYKKLARWCNNRFIFKTCKRFEDYNPNWKQ